VSGTDSVSYSRFKFGFKAQKLAAYIEKQKIIHIIQLYIYMYTYTKPASKFTPSLFYSRLGISLETFQCVRNVT